MKTNIPRSGAARFVNLVMSGLFAFNISAAFAQNEAATRPKTDKAVYAAIEKVPAKARAKLNPLEKDPNAPAAGGKLFEEHCAECHGMKAEGTKRGPSLLNEQVQQAAPGALFWILTNGVIRRGMPVWSKLPEPERWQIIAFLKSFRSTTVSQSRALSHDAQQETRTVRMDFRGADIGDFVYHCHIAGHEDNGMMAIIRVLPSAGSTNQGKPQSSRP